MKLIKEHHLVLPRLCRGIARNDVVYLVKIKDITKKSRASNFMRVKKSEVATQINTKTHGDRNLKAILEYA
jgi:hypothetical protein